MVRAHKKQPFTNRKQKYTVLNTFPNKHTYVILSNSEDGNKGYKQYNYV